MSNEVDNYVNLYKTLFLYSCKKRLVIEGIILQLRSEDRTFQELLF